MSKFTELAANLSAGSASSVFKPTDKHFVNTSTIISSGLGTVEYAACLQDKLAGNKKLSSVMKTPCATFNKDKQTCTLHSNRSHSK